MRKKSDGRCGDEEEEGGKCVIAERCGSSVPMPTLG